MDIVSLQIQNGVEFQTVTERLKGVEGWLKPLEGYTLLTLAQLGPGVGEIVEIGSYLGKSTCWLAYGSRKARRERITAVDLFKSPAEHQPGGIAPAQEPAGKEDPYHSFLENIQEFGVADHVVPLAAASAEAAALWHRDIRLLFIDGDRSYRSVKENFSLWSPHVVPWGLIVFHGYGTHHFSGVARCYDEILASEQEYKELYQVMSLRVLQKTA